VNELSKYTGRPREPVDQSTALCLKIHKLASIIYYNRHLAASLKRAGNCGVCLSLGCDMQRQYTGWPKSLHFQKNIY